MEAERKIGLGWTAENHRVVAHLAYRYSEFSTVTFMDHTTGPAPVEVSVSFEVVEHSWGQVAPEDRVIARRSPRDADTDTADFIDLVWRDHHLNTVHAECAHMTPEDLSKRADETTTDWQTRMLTEVVCPETGYQWGHAWLAREVPADILARFRDLVDRGV